MSGESITVDAPGALPCPFCGSADVHNWASEDHGPGTWSMMCYGCECEGPHTDSQQQSIDLWNQRAPALRSIGDIIKPIVQRATGNLDNLPDAG